MQVRICQPQTSKDFEEYYDLRWRILRKPWNQPRGTQRDDKEESATHIMACVEDQIVAVGRIHFNSETEAQIRYMAVETVYQRKGIGSLVLQELEKKSREKGAKYIILDARENAIEFYESNGYRIIGEGPRLFNCINQKKMYKDLQ